MSASTGLALGTVPSGSSFRNPFFESLTKRVNALGRAYESGVLPERDAENLLSLLDSFNASVLIVEDLQLDRIHRTVTRAGKAILVTPREFRILEFMMRQRGLFLTRIQIIDGVWDDDEWNGDLRLVDAHICKIRKKIKQGSSADLISLSRGTGYCIG